MLTSMVAVDAHGHDGHDGAHAAHGPETLEKTKDNMEDMTPRLEEAQTTSHSSNGVMNIAKPESGLDSPLTQIVGVAILEFGVVLHRSVTSDCLKVFVLMHVNLVFSLGLRLRSIRTSKFCS